MINLHSIKYGRRDLTNKELLILWWYLAYYHHRNYYAVIKDDNLFIIYDSNKKDLSPIYKRWTSADFELIRDYQDRYPNEKIDWSRVYYD